MLDGVRGERSAAAGRAEFNPATNTIYAYRGDDELVIAHELMHAVEEHDPDFLQAEREYFGQRTAGKSVVRLEALTGDDRYGEDEYAYDMGSGCIDPYAFKVYPRGYELMSMGLEALYRDPGLYRRDPGMLRWVLGMMGRFGR